MKRTMTKHESCLDQNRFKPFVSRKMFFQFPLFYLNSAVEEKPIEGNDRARTNGGKFHTKVRGNPKVQKQAME